MKNILILTACLFSFVGCSSTKTTALIQPTAEVGPSLDSTSYYNLITKHTRHDLKYDGFYNKFEVYVTFLNSDVQTAILQKKSETLQWTTQKAQSERERMFQENATQTKFAMSFFIPSARLNDLHKAASIWKIYLEIAGERHEGKIVKRNGKLEDLQALYPYHNRWTVPYDVTFNVPLSGAESKNAKLILTSSQGTAILAF